MRGVLWSAKLPPKRKRPLQAQVESLSYDFHTRTGRLNMTFGCCDMEGCVELFERIDPGVRRIETFAAGAPDTIYLRSADCRDWSADCTYDADWPDLTEAEARRGQFT